MESSNSKSNEEWAASVHHCTSQAETSLMNLEGAVPAHSSTFLLEMDGDDGHSSFLYGPLHSVTTAREQNFPWPSHFGEGFIPVRFL